MPQENMTPPDAPMEEQGAVDPREGVNLKKAQIQLLEAELSEVDATLDAEFLERIGEFVTPEEMEMRFEDDVKPFLSMVEEKREAFYRSKLDELKGRIDAMKSEVADEEENLDIEDAKRAFLEAHPEADWGAIVDFFHNDMTPRQKEEIAGLGLGEMMEKVYAMYAKKNKKAPAKEEAPTEPTLPPEMNTLPSSAPIGDPSPAAKDDEYMTRIGLRR